MPSITTACRSKTERRAPVALLLFVALLAAAAAEEGAPLALFDIGAYAELGARPNPDDHAIVFIPSLVSVLLAAEQGNGAPLSEAQVLSLRDRAAVMAVPAESAEKLERGRGYRDIDPGECWQQWQEQRRQLLNP